MLTLRYERRHNVLMVRVTGVLSSEDIEAHDRDVLRFLPAHRDARAIYDFSEVDALAIPTSKIAQRGQRPAMIPDRVVVASTPAGADFARVIREQQSAAGLPEPTIVPKLEQAYALLGLDRCANFEAVEAA